MDGVTHELKCWPEFFHALRSVVALKRDRIKELEQQLKLAKELEQ